MLFRSRPGPRARARARCEAAGRRSPRAAGRGARGSGRRPDAASTRSSPGRAARRSSLPASLPFPAVAAAADEWDAGRGEAPPSRAASASASRALAHSRGRRRARGGGAAAGQRGRRALGTESARARARGAAAAPLGPEEGPRRRGGRGRRAGDLGAVRGHGVKCKLTMGWPGRPGRAAASLLASPSPGQAGRGAGSPVMPSRGPGRPAVTQDDHFPRPSGALLAALPASHHWLQTALRAIKPRSDLLSLNPLLLADFQTDCLLSR